MNEYVKIFKNQVRLVISDIWDYVGDGYIVIPTNLATNKKSGKAIMGRGLALQASQRYPKLKREYGNALKSNNTLDGLMVIKKYKLILLPVKFDFKDNASETLIQKSLGNLTKLLQNSVLANEDVFLPVVGGGHGNLHYEQVLPIILNFMLIHKRYILVMPPNDLYAKEEYRESFLPGISGKKDKRVSMSRQFSDINI